MIIQILQYEKPVLDYHYAGDHEEITPHLIESISKVSSKLVLNGRLEKGYFSIRMIDGDEVLDEVISMA
jgi:hypothetical protein